MPKRKKDAKYYKRKIRRMENKLRELSQESLNSSCSEEPRGTTPPPPTMEIEEPRTTPCPSQAQAPADEIEVNLPAEDDQLPEEFLLALGREGEEKEEIGEQIRPELALRWTKIMSEGLGKEARTNIINKYPTPSNFPNESAPIMNPEILATLSEPAIKRDRRIVTRQNLTGKLMTCLGRSLTNILQGNINSKVLIEEINDAAKIAAEIHHQDSSSRKFFALSGANKTIHEAVKSSKPDKFLFGTDCADKIKTAQSIQRTSTQIRTSDSTKKNKQPTGNKKQLNWRGPPQNQQPQHQQAPRGGQRQQHHQYKRQSRSDRPRQTDQKRLPARSKSRHFR